MSKNNLNKRGLVLRLLLFLSILFLLTSCGAVLRIESLEITFPTSESTLPTTATSTATATASPTQSPNVIGATVLENLRVRSGPGTSFSIIRVLSAGETVPLLGRNSDGSWLQISDGWISSQFVVVSGNIQNLPVTVVDPTPTQEIRRNRVSYNVNGEAIPDRAYLKAHLLRLCPTTLLIMNGMAYAVELEQELRSCGTLVAHRTYSYYEGDEWVVRSPQTIVNQWIAEGHPEIVRYSANEPSYGGNHSIQSFVASQVELMRLARQAGFTVIIGNNAVGTWNVFDFQAGYYDPMLRALAEYGHYLGLHEYTQTVLSFGVSQWPREWLLDRNRVQPANWPTMAQLPVAMQFDPLIHDMNYPRYYHLRRGDWWLLRADAIGVPRPHIWLTEWGWDSLADIKASIESLRNPFCVRNGKYLCDLRGVNTYENLWAWYYPQWTFAQAICEQIKWGDSIYPVDYIGFNLFTWGINPMWLHTDFSGRENNAHYQLHQCLENYHSQN